MSNIGSLTTAQYRELYGRNSTLGTNNQKSILEETDSILTKNYTTAQKIENSISGRDIKDDGKISAASKFCNFFKGIGNSIKNGVKSLFTPKGLLKTLAIGAACALGGPVVAGALAVFGIAKGAITVGKGAIAASKATTDAEAEQAWQNMGSGTFQVAVSAVALKAATGAIKSQTGVTKLSGKAIKNSLKQSKIGSKLGSMKENFVKAKDTAGSTSEAIRETLKQTKTGEKLGSIKESYVKAKETTGSASKAIKETIKETKVGKELSSMKSNYLKAKETADSTSGAIRETLKQTKVGKELSSIKNNYTAAKETAGSASKAIRETIKQTKTGEKLGSIKDNYTAAKEAAGSTSKAIRNTVKSTIRDTKTYKTLSDVYKNSGVTKLGYATTAAAHLVDDEEQEVY